MTLRYEFIIWHITTSGEMTKFSLSLCECYIRTEEKCGLLNFFTHGLAVVMKTNSSTLGFAACREFAFTTPAKPLVGKIQTTILLSTGIAQTLVVFAIGVLLDTVYKPTYISGLRCNKLTFLCQH